jgi:arylsulfatase A-like enzyme
MIRILASIIAVAALLIPGATPSDAESPRGAEVDGRPNILLIVTDDQRAEGTMRVMPSTRKLIARQGVEFTNTFAVSSQCCPSRASMMTGQYPHNHRVITNQHSGRLDHRATIQRYLQESGYLTAMAGKWLNRWNAEEDPPFWHHWAIHLGRSVSYYYGGTWNEDGVSYQRDRYSTDFIASKGVKYLRAFEGSDEQPWFIYLSPFAPHVPSQPEPKYEDAQIAAWAGNPAVFEEDRTDKFPGLQGGSTTIVEGSELRLNQLRTLMSVDDLVERVVGELEALGESENTLVIFMSDNGSLWGEHGLRGKTNLFTQSIHIPMMLRWPGVISPNVDDARLAANIDVAPTILEVAGLHQDSEYPMDGRNLLQPTNRDHIILSGPEQNAVALRTLTYHYAEYYSDDGKDLVWTEYYDLVADPWQLNDPLHDADPANDVDVSDFHELLSKDTACRGICP